METGEYKFATILESVVGDRLSEGQTVFSTTGKDVSSGVMHRANNLVTRRYQEVYPDGVEYEIYEFEDDTKLVAELEESIYFKALEELQEIRLLEVQLKSMIEVNQDIVINYRNNLDSSTFKEAVIALNVLKQLDTWTISR